MFVFAYIKNDIYQGYGEGDQIPRAPLYKFKHNTYVNELREIESWGQASTGGWQLATANTTKVDIVHNLWFMYKVSYTLVCVLSK